MVNMCSTLRPWEVSGSPTLAFFSSNMKAQDIFSLGEHGVMQHGVALVILAVDIDLGLLEKDGDGSFVALEHGQKERGRIPKMLLIWQLAPATISNLKHQSKPKGGRIVDRRVVRGVKKQSAGAPLANKRWMI